MSARKPPACDLTADGVPSCDTGPGGRLVWVYRELRMAWQDHHRRSHVPPADHQEDRSL